MSVKTGGDGRTHRMIASVYPFCILSGRYVAVYDATSAFEARFFVQMRECAGNGPLAIRPVLSSQISDEKSFPVILPSLSCVKQRFFFPVLFSGRCSICLMLFWSNMKHHKTMSEYCHPQFCIKKRQCFPLFLGKHCLFLFVSLLAINPKHMPVYCQAALDITGFFFSY